eukprot:s2757_g9.t1
MFGTRTAFAWLAADLTCRCATVKDVDVGGASPLKGVPRILRSTLKEKTGKKGIKASNIQVASLVTAVPNMVLTEAEKAARAKAEKEALAAKKAEKERIEAETWLKQLAVRINPREKPEAAPKLLIRVRYTVDGKKGRRPLEVDGTPSTVSLFHFYQAIEEQFHVAPPKQILQPADERLGSVGVRDLDFFDVVNQ